MINSLSSSPVLICPYTLPEEETFSWAVLLFGQAVLLHPYPLPLPASCLEAVHRTWIQVRTQNRSREEIHKKNRILRELGQSLANIPGVDFLKYLAGISSLGELETQEEITRILRGMEKNNLGAAPPALPGPILLCWIHHWMMEQWEVETSLAEIEEKERLMTLGWQENLDEKTDFNPLPPAAGGKPMIEIFIPAAWDAWQELKKALVPENRPLLTNQNWVWEKHYGRPPEADSILSFPLPSLNTLQQAASQNHSLVLSFRDKMKGLLSPPGDSSLEGLRTDFQTNLSRLGLPEKGKYSLILPSTAMLKKTPGNSAGEEASSPLILLSSSGD
jgi:hypothetical protein